ncbi:transcriptional antiterminator [Streptomyces sp. BI20]|uniref:transcriptional antiterminator n=1 Tax=Streptomyces sp. BI20 TaxID=3403460 RepID=UPI003C73DA95
MDERLALRLELLRDSGRVPPEVASFVGEELGLLAREGYVVTETTAGMLTGHLAMALTRLADGEPVTRFLTDEAVTAELAGHPGATARARALADRAALALGASLPASEVNFLGMHLAVLARQSR